MKIEHIALYVNDLGGAKAFFERYFGAVSGELYRNKATGFCSYFLSFENGARLEIMNRPEINGQPPKQPHVGYSHIAFSTGSRENVENLTARLKADGYEVTSGPRTTGDGYYESSILGFEGNRIEITV